MNCVRPIGRAATGQFMTGLPPAPVRSTTSCRVCASRPFGPGHHHADFAAAASRAHKPLAPIRDGRLDTVALGRFDRVLHLRVISLDLSDVETVALTRPLRDTIDGDRYSLSPRIQTLKGILVKLAPEPGITKSGESVV
jgi:hypothetical protein